jgi:hypothetical protein
MEFDFKTELVTDDAYAVPPACTAAAIGASAS